MHFGIFLEERRRGAGEAQAFRETLELADAAEAWGLDGVWLGEIHFNPARSVQSAPLALASFIAARTRRGRAGPAGQVLPLGNPLRFGRVLRRHIPELGAHLQACRAAWRDAGHAGHGDVCLRIPVYAGARERDAIDEPCENITYLFRRHAELARSGLGRADTGPGE